MARRRGLYKIVRFYRDRGLGYRRTLKTGLTLEEAQAHCNDPETSSRTESRRSQTTRRHGAWFDGYDHE